MQKRSTIFSHIKRVASEQKKTLKPLDDNLPLLESGLDSLCFAILVARLEEEFGFDPFSLSDTVEFPVTLGEFLRCYEQGENVVA